MTDDTAQIWQVTVELDWYIEEVEKDIGSDIIALYIGIRPNQSEDKAQEFAKKVMARNFGEGILKHIKSITCKKSESAE